MVSIARKLFALERIKRERIKTIVFMMFGKEISWFFILNIIIKKLLIFYEKNIFS